ncbi:neutral zinc metallopeptidase [Streptomyces sp. NPDC020801]|uniref:neutral zinc metallopeptidase n=1 Tax=unclassified Streptomyces TaxID=2593676 RepID=UPI0037ACD390
MRLPLESDGTSAPQSLRQPTTAEVSAYLRNVLSDLDATWAGFFGRLGLPHRQVSYVLVTPQQQSARSRCIDAKHLIIVRADYPNAFYCQADQRSSGSAGTLFLPVTTLQRIWEGDILGRPSRTAGDHSAAIIAAHEFAHYVTAELRWQFEQRGVEYAAPTGKWDELLADCMAGVWAAHTRLRRSDVREAVTTLEKIGDYDYSSPTHHGTPAERGDAVLVGFNGVPGRYASRTPAACVAKYWRAVS